MTGLKTILAAAKRPERTFDLCLRGDLQAEVERLDQELQETIRNSVKSLEGDARRDLARQIENLREEMEQSTVTLTIRALRADLFRTLEAQHPPRPKPTAKEERAAKGDPDQEAALAARQVQADQDERFGFNTETFWWARIRECVVDPVLDDDDWETLAETVTNRQADDLAMVCYQVNRGEVSVPFSRAASSLILDSEPS